MTPQFDIFLLESNDEVRWIEAAKTLEYAARRVRELAALGHSRYLIFDLRTGTRQIVDHANPAPAQTSHNRSVGNGCQQVGAD